MNPFEMVAIIVVSVMIASVLRAKYSHRSRRPDEQVESRDHAERIRLEQEVKQLKERMQVLERIAVEKEDTLSREIDRLRDR